MTRRERPDLGWHAVGWGWLRRVWERHRLRRAGDLEPAGSTEVAKADDEDGVPPPLRWWRTALWCAAALAALALLDLRVASGALIGAAVTALIARHVVRHRADWLAHQLSRQHAYVTARAVRKARRRINRAAHEAAQAERDEAARLAREARRAANQQEHRRGSGA